MIKSTKNTHEYLVSNFINAQDKFETFKIDRNVDELQLTDQDEILSVQFLYEDNECQYLDPILINFTMNLEILDTMQKRAITFDKLYKGPLIKVCTNLNQDYPIDIKDLLAHDEGKAGYIKTLVNDQELKANKGIGGVLLEDWLILEDEQLKLSFEADTDSVLIAYHDDLLDLHKITVNMEDDSFYESEKLKLKLAYMSATLYSNCINSVKLNKRVESVRDFNDYSFNS